ncbi:lactonase family protein [Pseudomonas sp. App30]|uniref:lactonase family protein n=1 Tax=Pseudomonas sp. App30 TaxID=3068990 RepID=UPI003A808FF9
MGMDVLKGMKLGALFVALYSSLASAASENNSATRVYFGTHGDYIYNAVFNLDNGSFSNVQKIAKVLRPTWVVQDPGGHFLYSVSEVGNNGEANGEVVAFSMDRASGALTELNRVGSGGSGPTHMLYDGLHHSLVVANYGGGQVAVLPLAADGKVQPVSSVLADFGTGPTARQTQAHAHSITLVQGTHELLVPDLGADRVFMYQLKGKGHQLAQGPTPFVQMAPGTGPRGIEFQQDGQHGFLLSELSAQVRCVTWEPATQTLRYGASVDTFPAGFTGPKSASSMKIGPGEKFLYVADRSTDTLVVYRIAQGTCLEPIQRIGSGGSYPWELAIGPAGHWLVVANLKSDNVTSFKIDPQSGMLTPSGFEASIPQPVFAHFTGVALPQ